MKSLPSLPFALLVLRIGTPALFMAHAIVRILNGSIPQFASFLGSQGFPHPLLVVWIITAVELVAGLFLMFGRSVVVACFALAAIAFGGIVIIHARIGWFVGEHGTGGSEYSVSLLLCLLVLASAGQRKNASRSKA